MIKFKILIIFLYAPIFFFVLCPRPLNYLFAQDKIIAIVNNEIITQSDMNSFIYFMRLQLSRQYGEAETEEKIASMEQNFLDKLIEDRLILQEAKKANITVDPSRVKVKLNEIKKEYNSESEFQGALTAQGLVQADIESKIKDQLLMYQVIEDKIRRDIVITPSEITNFYEQNIEEFKVPAQREFTYLLFAEAGQAMEVYNMLKKGADLKNTAEKFNLNMNQITIAEGEQLKKEIADAISKLAIAEFTAPFKSEEKYYIFRFDRLIPSQQRSLNESQDSIFAFLFEKKMQERLISWLKDLKQKAYIKIMQG